MDRIPVHRRKKNGFKPGRSTADATQTMVRIQEDAGELIRRRGTLDEDADPEGRLLDLRKAYPRTNKPALWEILRRLDMDGNFLATLKDLHESSVYCVKTREGDTDDCHPERGLREGYSTSPNLFNVFHQTVITLADKKRHERTDQVHLVSNGKYQSVSTTTPRAPRNGTAKPPPNTSRPCFLWMTRQFLQKREKWTKLLHP